MIDKMKNQAYRTAYQQQMQYQNEITIRWVWSVGTDKNNKIIVSTIPKHLHINTNKSIKRSKSNNDPKEITLEYLLAITDKLINHDSLPEAPSPY